MQVVTKAVRDQVQEGLVVRLFDRVVERCDLDAALHLKVKQLKLANVLLDQLRSIYVGWVTQKLLLLLDVVRVSKLDGFELRLFNGDEEGRLAIFVDEV